MSMIVHKPVAASHYLRPDDAALASAIILCFGQVLLLLRPSSAFDLMLPICQLLLQATGQIDNAQLGTCCQEPKPSLQSQYKSLQRAHIFLTSLRHHDKGFVRRM